MELTDCILIVVFAVICVVLISKSNFILNEVVLGVYFSFLFVCSTRTKPKLIFLFLVFAIQYKNHEILLLFYLHVAKIFDDCKSTVLYKI